MMEITTVKVIFVEGITATAVKNRFWCVVGSDWGFPASFPVPGKFPGPFPEFLQIGI
jgi:hypothetical protein